MSEPETEYTFVESKYQDRKVFSQKFKGTGRILGEDKEKGVFLIGHGEDEQMVLKDTQFKFKAVDDKYRERYVVNKDIKTASGGASINNGDSLATALMGVPAESLRSVAQENGFVEKFDGWVAKGSNPGQLRMNTGNVLRGKVNNGIQVYAFGNPIAEDMVELGKEKAELKAAAKAEKAAAKKAKEAEAPAEAKEEQPKDKRGRKPKAE